ncbi:hypothetical protein LCGC14_2106210 [marine sediment metagenome]|uniref:Uncharacterized protein n=1 Tax=marine sediment metagenome TaxID=412755 RepID=A0A0F9H4V7_9ZZZZ
MLKYIEISKTLKDEVALNKVCFRKKIRNRVTILNNTYNIGATYLYERYQLAELPIKAIHFHPTKLNDGNHDRNDQDHGASLFPRPLA